MHWKSSPLATRSKEDWAHERLKKAVGLKQQTPH